MGNRLCAGKPSQYVTYHLGQLSLPSLWGSQVSRVTMSARAILGVALLVQSREVSPHNFDGLAMSVLAISASPAMHYCNRTACSMMAY